jgi:hypothetical protein
VGGGGGGGGKEGEEARQQAVWFAQRLLSPVFVLCPPCCGRDRAPGVVGKGVPRQVVPGKHMGGVCVAWVAYACVGLEAEWMVHCSPPPPPTSGVIDWLAGWNGVGGGGALSPTTSTVRAPDATAWVVAQVEVNNCFGPGMLLPGGSVSSRGCFGPVSRGHGHHFRHPIFEQVSGSPAQRACPLTSPCLLAAHAAQGVARATHKNVLYPAMQCRPMQFCATWCAVLYRANHRSCCAGVQPGDD